MKLFVAIAMLIGMGVAGKGQVPAGPQTQPIALIGATAHIGNGQVIENSVIVFDNGKISFMGKAGAANYDASKTKVIDVSGKHIYPGFIAPNTTLGLTEIFMVRATSDFDEAGEFNPNVRSLIAYNTDSKIIPTVRSNGVLLVQATPHGGIVSGTSSIMETDGWNWEDAVYKKDDGIHLHLPRMFTYNWDWLTGEGGKVERNKKRDEKMNQIKTFFLEAKAYCQKVKPEKTNLKLEAMRGVFNGSQNLYIYADFARDIMDGVNFAKELSIPKPVIVGGRDAWRVTDILKTNNVPVILFRLHELPYRDEEDIDLSFKVPYLLQQAGVLFCLSYEGDMEAMGIRNLPFTAGTAAAYGLSKEEALMTITSNTAKILGIDKSVGTLEAGKDATLLVSTGDALDMRTNQVEWAWIRGKTIDLHNKQKELYKKYLNKYWGQ